MEYKEYAQKLENGSIKEDTIKKVNEIVKNLQSYREFLIQQTRIFGTLSQYTGPLTIAYLGILGICNKELRNV